MRRQGVPKTKLKGRYQKMKVDFNDKVRVFKTLGGEVIRQNRLEILVAAKASEIAGQQVLDVRQAVLILEEKGVKVSDVFKRNGEALTLRSVCIEVLNPPEVNERGKREEGWKVRLEKGRLMEEIYRAKEPLNLNSDQIGLLKRLLAESGHQNIVLRQAFDWLEGEDESKKEDKKGDEK